MRHFIKILYNEYREIVNALFVFSADLWYYYITCIFIRLTGDVNTTMSTKNDKKTSLMYKVIKGLIKLFYPKPEFIGIENIPEEPSIIVGNHTQLNGPLVGELYFPDNPYIWCAGQMMKLADVPSYAYQDFWSQKPKLSRPFYKTLSYLIAPLSVLLFNNARTIAVYRDARIISTFKDTIAKLKGGSNIIIFPEHDVKHNHIIYEFQENFIDIARLYYKRTGKELHFVPMYVAPKLEKTFLGAPIRFSAENDIAVERKRICEYLMAEITDMAVSLPEHTVVPYRNIPKKDYPTNKPQEVIK